MEKDENSFDINTPPPGTWIRKDFNSVVVGATTRSPFAFFFVPFVIVWSGLSVGNIYGEQIIEGEFDLVMSLFGFPFLVGSLVFSVVTLMMIFGKVELRLTKYDGAIFTGIGIIGITKKFVWAEISGITQKHGTITDSGTSAGSLELDGIRNISFATWVNPARRNYLFLVMKDVIEKVQSNKGIV